jgi:hypothetical protein
MKRALVRITATLLLAASALAHGHHSFAMFDMTKSGTWKGTVKEVQWTNPHVWIELTLTVDGKPANWSFEGAAIPVLKSAGWLKDTIKAGDSVTIYGHPYKDGRPGGSIDYVVLANGTKVGRGDNIPPALVVPGVN